VPEIAFIYITPVGGTLCLLRHIDVDARVRKGEPVSRLGCQPDKLMGVSAGFEFAWRLSGRYLAV
jgi:hypothetical protein